MTRKQPAQKKKRSSSSTQQPGLAGQKKAWSRSDKIAVIGVAVAIIGILLSLTIPEVRQFIGLDRPPKVSKQQLYPHLWEYYLGDEQILPGTKFTPLTLLYILGNPSGQSGRGG